MVEVLDPLSVIHNHPALALYEPDIPQNTGTLLRLSACLGFPLHIIEPAGFDTSDRNLKRAGLDYLAHVTLIRHLSFAHFESWRRKAGGRLILATTRGAIPYTQLTFEARDVVLLGRESAGVPEAVHQAADSRIFIPMKQGLRSINVSLAGSMLMGEALRQLDGFPRDAQHQ